MTASASDQLASQRVLRAGDQHDDRRAVVDLVLELAGQPHAAGRLGLAVEDRRGRCRPRRAARTTSALVAHSTQSMRPMSGRRAPPDGGPDLRPDVGGVAVDEDGARSVRHDCVMRAIVSAARHGRSSRPATDRVAHAQHDPTPDADAATSGQDIMPTVTSTATAPGFESSKVHSLTRPNIVSVGTIVWLSSELMFFAGPVRDVLHGARRCTPATGR